MTRIPTAYRVMRVKELIFEAESVATAMPTNMAFASDVPAYVPTAALIKQVAQELRAAYEAALTHDSNRIQERNEKQAQLVTLLNGVAKHYESVGVTNPDVFKSTGFSPPKSRRSSIPLLPAPFDFTVQHGPQPGSIIAKSSRLATAKCYEVHMAEGDPAIEQNWGHRTTVVDPYAILYGLRSGKECWARSRGINSAGEGAWSPVVSLVPK